MTQANVPSDLRDVLEMVQSGMVNLGGKYAVQLIERIGKLEADLHNGEQAYISMRNRCASVEAENAALREKLESLEWQRNASHRS
jgi:hypothetical protein